LADLNNS